MTVRDIIDYFEQFDLDALVVATAAEAPEGAVALDCIDLNYTAEDGA